MPHATKYPAGTRYCYSEYYDVATSEVVNGFQVFEQFHPSGFRTGRRSALRPDASGGTLIGLTIAAPERARLTQDAADDMAATLREVCEHAEATGELTEELRDRIASVLAEALGIWR